MDDVHLFTAMLKADPLDGFWVGLCYDQGSRAGIVMPEQAAFALAQITAANILPPLTALEQGQELLTYGVYLRDVLNPDLIGELVAVLDSLGPELHWDQVDANRYACVIGAGVAACLDVTSGQERLSLRYANTLAHALHQAYHPSEIPRSLLFLQTTLYERFDALLNIVRARIWYWLNG